MTYRRHLDSLHNGRIEVICGSMFSGKSEELIRRLKRARYANQKVQVFKPYIDNRYKEGSINSHSGENFEAIIVHNTAELLQKVDDDTIIVAIDEVQFFDKDVVQACQKLADSGRRVIVAGLDLDFKGEPFGCMPGLMAIAECVDKLQAICVKCYAPATRTQRLVNGKPARYDDEIILVAASECYEPRCRFCHEVPKRRQPQLMPTPAQTIPAAAMAV